MAHAQQSPNTKSLTRNLEKMLNGSNPKRTFGKVKIIGKNQFQISFEFDENEVLELLKKRNKCMLRFYMPTHGGVPVYMAQDALEKIRSLKRKHLLQTTMH